MSIIYTYAVAEKTAAKFNSIALSQPRNSANNNFAFTKTRTMLRLTLIKFFVFFYLTLWLPIGFAQSQCITNDEDILLCSFSISLLQKHKNSSGIVVEHEWQPTADELANIKNHLQQFSELWCETTLGKSRILDVSIYPDYKKSLADVALYKNLGRSNAAVGVFPKYRPSVNLFYAGYYDADNVDHHLYRVLTHEFSHAVFKIYDEYIERAANTAPHCLSPLASDNPRTTIMNNHIRYTRYSHPEDYANTPPAQTAQYRCYQESAWEVLLQPEACDNTLSLEINAWFPRQEYFSISPGCNPTIPSIDTLQNPQGAEVMQCIARTKEELNIKFFSDVENTAVVIDPNIVQDDNRMILSSMQRVIDTVINSNTSRTLAIMGFNSNDKTRLVDATPDNRMALIDELNRLINDSSALEDQELDDALEFLRAVMNDNFDEISNDYNSVMMISNTTTRPSTAALKFFEQHNIPVHTIGFGTATNPGLRMLSLATGGSYYTVSPQSEPELLSDLAHQNFAFVNEPYTEQSDLIIEQGKDAMLELSVTPGTKYVFFELSKNTNNDKLGDIIIRRPDGSIADTEITEVKTEQKTTHYIIEYPEPGIWDISIAGNGSFKSKSVFFVPAEIDIHAGSDLLPRTNNKMSTIAYPQPMMIMARVHGDRPLLNAQVVAEISTPKENAQPVQIHLADNGKSPDRVAGDSVYTGIMENYDDYGDGIYTIKVTASNPDGRAVFDDFGASTYATTYHEVTRIAPSFRHSKYSQVEVTASQSPNLIYSQENPLDIEADGMLNWNLLGISGTKNWFRLYTNNSGIYYIQTSNAFSSKEIGPIADISLYKKDSGSGELTFLASGDHVHATNHSTIEYPLENNTEYMISVTNTSNYTGIYALAVNFEGSVNFANGLLSQFEIDRARNSVSSGGSGGNGGSSGSSGGGGGGGAADHLLLIIVLTFLMFLHKKIFRLFGIGFPSKTDPRQR